MPGYVAAVRIGDRAEIHAGGRRAVEPESPPMTADTLFRIASVTKPLGAALTLALVQDGVLALDDPIDRWLPEAAKARVLVRPDAPLDQTTDLARPITIRHLLTMTSGWGVVLEDTPLQRAMIEGGVFPSAMPTPMSGDDFWRTVAGLPLAFQPGDGFLYETGMNVLGVLLTRATGTSLSQLFADRITGPLGMTDTAFHAVDVDRMAAAYMPGPDGLTLMDPPDGAFARPPVFEELSGGLVSTAADVLGFYTAMAHGGAPIISAESLKLMTSDQLTEAQRAAGAPFVDAGTSFGLGTGVDLDGSKPGTAPGRWGWVGGSGTSAYVDPVRDTVSVMLTQRAMMGPDDGPEPFWAAVADAADAVAT
ncbi:MAG: beta-lactamase family protein [Acidimicrobiia bacterium]|nr:beta-lactamase family protein [Acidimicrobiia bacterium]